MRNTIQDKLSLIYFDKQFQDRNENLFLIGIDEAGRGPLAGPVVACAAYVPEEAKQYLSDIKDSKKLSPQKRYSLFKKMVSCGVRFGFGYSTPQEIDTLNILNATFRAMREATLRLLRYLNIPQENCLLLVDGPYQIKDLNISQEAIIDGDSKSLSIACASIFAKVIRDNWMNIIDLHYPQYGFSKHKGYGTKYHIEKINEFGLSPVHRKSFKLTKKLCVR